jgi:hypothetical protein
MKSMSGTLGSLVLAILLVFCLFLIANDSFAADDLDTENLPKDGKVEVVYPVEKLLPYRERRGSWSGVFGVSVDQVFPDQYRSKINDDSYETLFGTTPINIIQAQVGAQYNFALGSISATLIAGVGEVDDSHGHSGVSDNLKVTKKGATLSYMMDALFSEPYVVPYIQGQLISFDWEENRLDQSSKSGTTDFGGSVTFGLLIQLNALDPVSSLQAQDTIGLNNTFLDLFVSQYNLSETETNPNFETGVNYGAGLRLEF